MARVFLTNKVRSFRGVMCDLWRNTLTETVPAEAIPAPYRSCAACLFPPAKQLKLYNSGSFFDPHAILRRMIWAIVKRANRFDRVDWLENYLALIFDVCLRFRADASRQTGGLAMGCGELEHPLVLAEV